jgi:phenylpyruvate tautomerase PptA (4-oxalocrotonate tautomerase family)
MPITVTAPRGVLTPEGEREVLPRLTTALAEATDAAGDDALIATIGGTVHVLPERDVYAGGKPAPVVFVELKLPPVALSTVERRSRFITAATRIVADLTVEDHDDQRTWVNILHAPEGAWGIGGHNIR